MEAIEKENISSFIPIITHYDDNTLICKDGTLIQMVKFFHLNAHDDAPMYEDALVQTVQEAVSYIDDPMVSVSMHVVRDDTDISCDNSLMSEKLRTIDEQWNSYYEFNCQLQNEVYLSISYKEARSRNEDKEYKKFKDSPGIFEDLSERFKKLNSIVENMLESCRLYGGKRLTTYEKDSRVYSQLLGLYYNILNLHKTESVELTAVPLDQLLADDIELRFGFNSGILKTGGNKEYFAIFYVKQVHPSIPGHFADFLQANIHYLISEHLVFTKRKPFFDELKEEKKLYSYTYSDAMSDRSSTDRMLSDEMLDDPLAVCERQITILVYGHTKEEFESSVNLFAEAINNIGITVVREDMNAPTAFYSQLPGNQHLLNREHMVSRNSVGNFASVYRKECGNYLGSKWKMPIMLFRTVDWHPHYFSFHDYDCVGHTLFVGPKYMGKSVLMRLITLNATRVGPKLVVFDTRGNVKDFVDAINGVCIKVSKSAQCEVKACYSVQMFDSDVKKLSSFFHSVISDNTNIEGAKELFDLLAEKVIEKDIMDKLPELLEKLVEQSNDETLRNYVKKWREDSGFSNLFTSVLDENNISFLKEQKVVAFDLSEIYKDKSLLCAYITLIMQNMMHCNAYAGQKNIVVINDISLIIHSTYFDLPKWMSELEKKDGLLLTGVDTDNKEALSCSNFKPFFEKCATQIFLANKFAEKGFAKIFSLSYKEMREIKTYDTSTRICMVKKNNYAVSVKTDITPINSLLELIRI